MSDGNTKINQETQPNIGKLYAEGSTDLILGAIYAKAEASKTDTTGGEQDSDEDALRTANYLNFLNKLGQYPKVHFTMYPRQNYETVKRGFDVNSTLYIVSYEDKQLLKIGKGDVKKYNDVSILLPINFTFTIHGISGIKRGDRFGVIGIPKKYEKQGFFQVIGVKHSIQGMEWTTEVTGGYRNFKFEDTGVDKKED